MVYRILVDTIIIFHLIFIVFVVFGGFLLFIDRRWALLHIPSVIWGTLVEIMDFFCPLTPLENWLREMGGFETYRIDFVERYLLPIIYPAQLTKNIQITLGLSVLAINLFVYFSVFLHWKKIERRK